MDGEKKNDPLLELTSFLFEGCEHSDTNLPLFSNWRYSSANTAKTFTATAQVFIHAQENLDNNWIRTILNIYLNDKWYFTEWYVNIPSAAAY